MLLFFVFPNVCTVIRRILTLSSLRVLRLLILIFDFKLLRRKNFYGFKSGKREGQLKSRFVLGFRPCLRIIGRKKIGYRSWITLIHLSIIWRLKVALYIGFNILKKKLKSTDRSFDSYAIYSSNKNYFLSAAIRNVFEIS